MSNENKPTGQDQPAGSWASFNGLTYRSGSLPTPPVMEPAQEETRMNNEAMAKEYASDIDWTNDEAVVRAVVPGVVISLGGYEEHSAGIWTRGFGYFMGDDWQTARQYYCVRYFERLYNPSYEPACRLAERKKDALKKALEVPLAICDVTLVILGCITPALFVSALLGKGLNRLSAIEIVAVASAITVLWQAISTYRKAMAESQDTTKGGSE